MTTPWWSPHHAVAADGQVPAGGIVRVSVPEAFGGKTVVGQLAVDGATRPGFVTAFGCADGLPTGPDGVARADLNFDGRVTPVWSNRLIVQADAAGDVCFYTSAPAALIVDVNGATFDTGINSFPNRRTDTRIGSPAVVARGGTLRLNVPEARGAKTVVGQIAVDRVAEAGFVTAYPCATGLPTGPDGATRSDLNYDGAITPVWSNRLIVQADMNGDVCLYTSKAAALVVDINGTSDVGLASFANRRIDTRSEPAPRIPAGGVLRVQVPEATGAATVIGQLAVDRADTGGFVTAYACDEGLPVEASGAVRKADLNFDGRITRAWSNRLIAQADSDGDLCLYTSRAASLIVDVNGVSDIGIQSFPNRRTDTRLPGAGDSTGPIIVDGVPVWPPYVPLPALHGIAALTGLPADAAVTSRPIVAVKIDNYASARPQFGLAHADAVVELDAEGITRFIALFHTTVPTEVGPVRSARTGDVDLVAAMNRPVFGYSGANAGVNTWFSTAASAGLLVDFSAQRNGCYTRDPTRPGPHNLILDAVCASALAPNAGPARPLWDIDATWTVAATGMPAIADVPFTVPMDGVVVQWEWDAAIGGYRRSQDGEPHVTASGEQITAHNVVVIEATYVPSPVDARSPNPITVGEGRATIHRDGQQVAVTWSRPTAYDAFTFHVAATGAAVPLDSGTTYLEITRRPPDAPG